MAGYMYNGAGNRFLIFREGDAPVEVEKIVELCSRHGTDGLMVLCGSPEEGFRMLFYNPDGSSEGLMCGNGGRCFADLAQRLGLCDKEFSFMGPDGPHHAKILSADRDARHKLVSISMSDVASIEDCAGISPWGTAAVSLNTGCPHLVVVMPDDLPLKDLDIEDVAPALRRHPRFAPKGTNVDFIKVIDGQIWVRTFETGVEGETLACGTGIVASALAAHHLALMKRSSERLQYDLHSVNDILSVSFCAPACPGAAYTCIVLTGPTEFEGCNLSF